MNKMKVLYIFAGLFFIASVAIHVLLSEHPSITLYSDFIAVAVAILPVITGLYVFFYFERGSFERTVWLVLVAGLLLWLAGEMLWFYYEVLMNMDPFPSLADAAWILGFPFIMAALILQYRTVKVRLERKYELGAAVVFFMVGIVMFFSFGDMIAADEEFTLLEKALSLFYPVADLFLLYFALLITGQYWAGKLSYAWLLVVAGIIAYGVGDLWYAHLEWLEIYGGLGWHPVDFAWTIGDLLVFLGAAKYRISFEELV